MYHVHTTQRHNTTHTQMGLLLYGIYHHYFGRGEYIQLVGKAGLGWFGVLGEGARSGLVWLVLAILCVYMSGMKTRKKDYGGLLLL
ncbi:hypothetical protein B0T17DRAFT_539829 [Bombardia bombarda]|uniref:Uncharacterized protein n=1 Tax=Bombardia bombarda TaxID=252184 RepID=A0AA40BWB7_9PEZI|nr:hypothetical protein B0T17DRAFT_539829 [Bombardia bombarda]